MYTISWMNVKSAVINGLIAGIIAIMMYIIGIGDIFNIDYRLMANIGVVAALTTIATVVKSFFTTDAGKFADVVKVAPPVEE